MHRRRTAAMAAVLVLAAVRTSSQTLPVEWGFDGPAGPLETSVAFPTDSEIRDSIAHALGPDLCSFSVQVGSARGHTGQPGDYAEFFAFETGPSGLPWAVGYITLGSSGRFVTFGIDISGAPAIGPGEYPLGEIGGDLGFDDVPFASYDDEVGSLQVDEYEANTRLVGAIVGLVRNAIDPDLPAVPIRASFDIHVSPPSPIYSVHRCVVVAPGG